MTNATLFEVHEMLEKRSTIYKKQDDIVKRLIVLTRQEILLWRPIYEIGGSELLYWYKAHWKGSNFELDLMNMYRSVLRIDGTLCVYNDSRCILELLSAIKESPLLPRTTYNSIYDLDEVLNKVNP